MKTCFPIDVWEPMLPGPEIPIFCRQTDLFISGRYNSNETCPRKIDLNIEFHHP
jgi:hypothetical protein